MTLLRRIHKLEAHHGHTLNACSTCGGYDPLNPGFVITRHERELELCCECGSTLNEEGRPLVTWYKRVILPDDAPDDVP